MPRFILVRHGESIWNSERRIQGSLDPDLSPRGRRQTDLLVSHLRADIRQPVAAVYTSPLRRAAQTAGQIAEALRLPVIPDPDLRELFLGNWEGKTVAEIQASAPGWRIPRPFRPPGARTSGHSSAAWSGRSSACSAPIPGRT